MLTVPGKVRDVMGTDGEISIEDEQILTLIGVAEKQIREELFTHVVDDTPGCNPLTGALWDGSNTSFNLGEPVQDHDFDESTTDDVIGYYFNSSYTPTLCACSVTNARYGRVTITQVGGAPIPSTAVELYVDYYTAPTAIPFSTLEEMGTYLTAHLVVQRLTEPKKVGLVDLQSNQTVFIQRKTQFLEQYERLKSSFGRSMLGSTDIDV
jgi:hypothetical protein